MDIVLTLAEVRLHGREYGPEPPDHRLLAQGALADSKSVREDIVLLGLQCLSEDSKSGCQAAFLC